MKTKYIIITPVRDEEQYIQSTLESVAGQTIAPLEWMIVDDGSRDRTAEIVQQYARQHSWIRLLRRENRGFRKSGAGVVEAFYDGYDALECKDYDFLVKLDGDLSFPPDYFTNLLERFHTEGTLGIAGGDLFHEVDGELQLEKCPRFHVRGATKFYRRECWEAIGGLVTQPGWDIVDETKANMLGWKTESFADLKVIHHRFTGTAENKWKDQVKNGRAYYVAGYHPLFMAAKCVFRLASRPYLTGALGMAYGFLSGYLKGSPQVGDPALIQYIRRQQLRRLCGAETIWK
jgi:glycosyltransferase involved in cell wall biosynthesis